MLRSQWAEDDREDDDDYNGNGRHVGKMLQGQWADRTEEIEQHAAESVSQFYQKNVQGMTENYFQEWLIMENYKRNRKYFQDKFFTEILEWIGIKNRQSKF